MVWFLPGFLYLFVIRSQHRRRLQNVDDEGEKEEKAIDGKACEEDYKFAEIVGVYSWNNSYSLSPQFFSFQSSCGY